MADVVVVIKLEDQSAAIEAAVDRLEPLVAQAGLGEVAGHMSGLGTVVFIDVAPEHAERLAEFVLPSLRTLAAQAGLVGAVVEVAPEEDDEEDEAGETAEEE